jgi:hypothetical protein
MKKAKFILLFLFNFIKNLDLVINKSGLFIRNESEAFFILKIPKSKIKVLKFLEYYIRYYFILFFFFWIIT